MNQAHGTCEIWSSRGCGYAGVLIHRCVPVVGQLIHQLTAQCSCGWLWSLRHAVESPAQESGPLESVKVNFLNTRLPLSLLDEQIYREFGEGRSQNTLSPLYELHREVEQRVHDVVCGLGPLTYQLQCRSTGLRDGGRATGNSNTNQFGSTVRGEPTTPGERRDVLHSILRKS